MYTHSVIISPNNNNNMNIKENINSVKDILHSHKVNLSSEITELAVASAESPYLSDLNEEIALKRYKELVKTVKAIDFVYDLPEEIDNES